MKEITGGGCKITFDVNGGCKNKTIYTTYSKKKSKQIADGYMQATPGVSGWNMTC